jgi:hypothetical protein
MGTSQSTVTDIEDAQTPCGCEGEKQAACDAVCEYNPSLVGTVKKLYTRHILLCTGEMDWAAKILHEEGSFAAELSKEVKRRVKSGEVSTAPLITAISEPSHTHTKDSIDIIVFPEGVVYPGVTRGDLGVFVQQQVVSGTIAASLPHHTLPFDRLVLVCTHGSRDRRCGRLGPETMESIGAMLDRRGVGEERVRVRGTSHVGGHKHAAVVIVYPEGDWYGQMSKKNAEELVDCYLAGSLYHSHWRGKMGEEAEQSKGRLPPQ